VKVAVNLMWLRPGQVGGSEEYLTRTLGALDEPDVELTLFVQAAFAKAHPALAALRPLVTLPAAARSQPVRVSAEHTWLPVAARGFDLVHHAGSTAPRVPTGPFVLTVHDLQYLTFPQFFRAPRRAFLKATTPSAVRRADVVTAPSDYVRGRIVECFGVHPDRIVEVPHGVDADLGRLATSEVDVRARYGLHGPYVVYPAITHRHKNHGVLLEVMAKLRSRNPGLRLVLTGGAGHAEPDVDAAIARLGLRDAVVRTGRVSSADRDGLVRHAAVLAFPSRYEGFGAPVLEAMHLGCPVVAADATALPEVVGGAGLLVDPLDVDGWVDALLRVVDDHDEAQRLRLAGRDRAAAYSSRRSAAALVAAYRQALA
jgi:glycosyltransferase involved in cell wall biosynthesis